MDLYDGVTETTAEDLFADLHAQLEVERLAQGLLGDVLIPTEPARDAEDAALSERD